MDVNNTDVIKDEVISIIITELKKNDIPEETIAKLQSLSIDEDISELSIINSLNFIRIVPKIEEKYDFEFDDENLNYILFKNLRSLIEYINSKI